MALEATYWILQNCSSLDLWITSWRRATIDPQLWVWCERKIGSSLFWAFGKCLEYLNFLLQELTFTFPLPIIISLPIGYTVLTNVTNGTPTPLGTHCARTDHNAVLQVSAMFRLRATLNLDSGHLEGAGYSRSQSNLWPMMDRGFKVSTSAFLTLGKDIFEGCFTLSPWVSQHDCVLVPLTSNLIKHSLFGFLFLFVLLPLRNNSQIKGLSSNHVLEVCLWRNST